VEIRANYKLIIIYTYGILLRTFLSKIDSDKLAVLRHDFNVLHTRLGTKDNTVGTSRNRRIRFNIIFTPT